MSRRDPPSPPAQEESLLARMSRRKHEARGVAAAGEERAAVNATQAVQASSQMEPSSADEGPPTDADMPAIESLTPDSDYSGFLSPRVSEGLRRLALRRLWLSPDFGLRDGLEVYDGDYTAFEPLGGLVTAEMRHELAVEARRQAQREVARGPAASEPGRTPQGDGPQGLDGLAAESVGPAPSAPEDAPDDSEAAS